MYNILKKSIVYKIFIDFMLVNYYFILNNKSG